MANGLILRAALVLISVVFTFPARSEDIPTVNGISLPDMYAFCDVALNYYQDYGIKSLATRREQDEERKRIREEIPYWKEAARSHYTSEKFENKWSSAKARMSLTYNMDIQQGMNSAAQAGKDSKVAGRLRMRWLALDCQKYHASADIKEQEHVINDAKAELEALKKGDTKARPEYQVTTRADGGRLIRKEMTVANTWAAIPDEFPYITFGKTIGAPTVTLIISMECVHCLQEIQSHWQTLFQLADQGKINIKLLLIRRYFLPFDAEKGTLTFADRANEIASCVGRQSSMKVLMALVARIQRTYGSDLGVRKIDHSGWVPHELAQQYDIVLNELRAELGPTGVLTRCNEVNPVNYSITTNARLSTSTQLGIENIPALIFDGNKYTNNHKDIERGFSIDNGLRKIAAVSLATAQLERAEPSKSADCAFVEAVRMGFKNDFDNAPAKDLGSNLRQLGISIRGSKPCVYAPNGSMFSRLAMTCEWDASKFSDESAKAFGIKVISSLASCVDAKIDDLGGGPGFSTGDVTFMWMVDSEMFGLMTLSDGVKK